MHGRKNPKSGKTAPPTPEIKHARSGQKANAGGAEGPNQDPRGESRRTGSRPPGPGPQTGRGAAFAVVRRVFEDGAYADRALHAEAEGLAPRERALATRLAYGTVQRKATLDHVIETLARRPTAKLEPAVLAALRLGVFQLAFMDRVPAHAAVGESVELAKRHSRGGAGLVNAVLRRAATEARPLIDALPDRHPRGSRAAPFAPGLDRRAVVRPARRRRGARADGVRQRARRGGDPRQHAQDHRRSARRAAARRAGRPARGAGAHAPVRRVRLAALDRRPVHAAVTRRAGGLARARPAAGRAPCSTSAPPPAPRPRTWPR